MRRSLPWQTKALHSLVLCILCWAMTGCAVRSDRSDFAGPDWSRGRVIGLSVLSNRPALAWHPQTRHAYLVWVAQEEDVAQLHFAELGERGETLVTRPLELSLREPSHPRLWCDPQGRLLLWWLDALGDGTTALYYVALARDGALLSPPQRLSPSGHAVTGYCTTPSPSGLVDVFWSDGLPSPPGLYHTRVNPDGASPITARSLGITGSMPACATDSQQRIHLAWYAVHASQGGAIAYAPYDPVSASMGPTEIIATVPLGTLYPPEIGLDWQHAYVLWAQERRGGGPGSPSAEMSCRSLTLQGALIVRDCKILLPPSARPKYVSAEGDLAYSSLAHVEEEERQQNSDYVYMPYAVPGQRQELGVMLSARLMPRRGQAQIQVLMAVLRQGELSGYQVAAQTRSASLRPVAVADDEGQIHLAWVDTAGFGRYQVYYASTRSEVRKAMNRLTLADISGAFTGRLWNAAAAFSFFPMLLVWLFPPLVWLVFSYLLWPDRDLTTFSGRLWLGGAIVLYLGAKTLLIPNFLGYAPFLEILPARFQDLLMFGLPGVIALAGLVFTRSCMARFDRQEVLYAFAIFAATDATLSFLLYIPNIVGT